MAYIPLESNPDVFTGLMHRLGVSRDLAFYDVLSLDEADLLAMIPRPALALVLAFPAASPAYEHRIEAQERDTPVYSGSGDQERVLWFRQTIRNACGLYALLHAVANGARDYIAPQSILSRLLDECRPLAVDDRARALESDMDVATAHREAALQGVTEAPACAEDDVDHHYVCFAKSSVDGFLYELDGDRKGPVSWVDLGPQNDLLSDPVRAVLRDYIHQGPGDGGSFSLLALAPNP